ncbi:MAG TPA: hypothetical protein VE046_18280 [Steroidobacteraceae bacterium]|nr:hypothetical protein [Steroidobacteraceae bacterium]
MRNTILATVLALGLSAFALGANNPATPAAPATAAPPAATAAKPPVDPKTADCQHQAKEKGLKGTEAKKFVAECVKKAS